MRLPRELNIFMREVFQKVREHQNTLEHTSMSPLEVDDPVNDTYYYDFNTLADWFEDLTDLAREEANHEHKFGEDGYCACGQSGWI
jgi:hypothetical protein